MVWLVDGGFGTHLEQHYVGAKALTGDKLWSARLNVTRPEVVLATHRDFLEAGADLIRTNTYQASLPGYVKFLELSEEQAKKVIEETIDLAVKAREEFVRDHPEKSRGREIKILASIGPYGAWLSDGSEYSGSYGDTVPDEVVREFHKDRLEVILKNGVVDGLAVETIPLKKEAEIIVDLLNEFHPKTKFWVSFSCKDEHSLVHGDDFKDAVESIWHRVADKANLLAIGVNCLNPKFVTPLLAHVENRTRSDVIPLVAYPNSGEVYDAKEKNWKTPVDCSDFISDIPTWIELGVKFVGGCCRNDANRIRMMREYIDENNLK